jgi:FecR protein
MGQDYTFTVSGTVTDVNNTGTCEYDFAYSKCTSGPGAGTWKRDGKGIVVSPNNFASQNALASYANPQPAFREDHVYTFTWDYPDLTKAWSFWAVPWGNNVSNPPKYSGGFKLRIVGPDGSTKPPVCKPPSQARVAQSCPAPDPCDAASESRMPRARSAAINEVRVVAVQPDVQVHRAGTPDDCWSPVERDTVLKQGDEISCDPDGSATLQFADNSTTVVKNTSQLKIASYFTEGGVVRTEILLKMGEVASQHETDHGERVGPHDMRIKTGHNHAGSVRGTKFSAFYDPSSGTSQWAVTEGSVAVLNGKGGAEQLVTAGKEAMISKAGKVQLGALGKVGRRGGVSIQQARERVLKVIAKGNDPCKATTPPRNAFAIKPASNGWAVGVKVTGKLKGTSKWSVIGGRVKAKNSLAKRLRKACR